jgi:hypothetical protein
VRPFTFLTWDYHLNIICFWFSKSGILTLFSGGCIVLKKSLWNACQGFFKKTPVVFLPRLPGSLKKREFATQTFACFETYTMVALIPYENPSSVQNRKHHGE